MYSLNSLTSPTFLPPQKKASTPSPFLLRVLKIIPAIFWAFVCAVDALTTERLPRLVAKPRNDADTHPSWRRIASTGLADTEDGTCNSVAIYLCVTASLIPMVIPSETRNLLKADKIQERQADSVVAEQSSFVFVRLSVRPSATKVRFFTLVSLVSNLFVCLSDG